MSQTSEIQVDNFKVLVPASDSLESWTTAKNNTEGAIDIYELERNRGNVPSVETRDQSFKYNRTAETKGKGLYQIALRAERAALRDGVDKYWEEDKYGSPKDKALEMVDFLPNARLGYLNKLIKQAMRGKGLTRLADVDAVQTIWMGDSPKATLVKLLRIDSANNKLDGYSIPPTPSRSGIKLRDAEGLKTGQYIALTNPGNVYLPFERDQEQDTSIAELLLSKLDSELNRLYDQQKVIKDMTPLFEVANYNNPVIRTLLALRDKLLDRHLRYDDVIKLSEALHKMIGFKRSKYLMSLSNPFKHRSAKIPTLISPKSASFSIRNMVPLTTNATGNVAFCFNPFFLTNPANPGTCFAINNNVALTGLASSNFFLGVEVGQTEPADFYVRYRVVSAGIRIYTFPSSNNDNGLVTTSVTYEGIGTTTVGVAITNAAQFGDFAQIENGFYKQTSSIASKVIQENLYIPIDESFWDYTQIQQNKLGFAWVGYITGAAPSSTIARAEIVVNYEGLLDNAYTDYLPADSPNDEENDPKNIMAAISNIKNSEVLDSKSMSNIVVEGTPDSNQVLELPPPKHNVEENKQSLNKVISLMKDTINSQLEKLKPQTKSNWLDKMMEVLSPLAGSIISSVVNPFSSMALPFKF